MRFDLSIILPHLGFLLEGAWLTAQACALALLGSFILGALVAIAGHLGVQTGCAPSRWSMSTCSATSRSSSSCSSSITACRSWASISTPSPPASSRSPSPAAPITSDVIRAGILAIDPGIIEAAEVSGLSKTKIFSKIVLPIALRTSIRPLGSVFINLILTSSILSTITLNELTGTAKIVASDTFRPFEIYFVLLVAYAALTWLVSIAIGQLHRHLNKDMMEAVG